jgi:hypothetical protein
LSRFRAEKRPEGEKQEETTFRLWPDKEKSEEGIMQRARNAAGQARTYYSFFSASEQSAQVRVQAAFSRAQKASISLMADGPTTA